MIKILPGVFYNWFGVFMIGFDLKKNNNILFLYLVAF